MKRGDTGMKSELPCLLILGLYIQYILCYYHWNASKRERKDLLCPNQCRKDEYIVRNDLAGRWEETCCNCESKASWEFLQNETFSLQLEYISVQGIAKILPSDSEWKYLILRHTMGELKKILVNICEFPSIVKIDLTGNKLTEIGNISCLQNLNILLLSKNKIKFISNKTFAGLSYLREIDLSHNNIKTVECNAFSKPELGLFRVNLNNNHLEEIDVSNIVIAKSFCDITFENNEITKVVNLGNMTLDNNITYGQGGHVSLRDNKFERFPNLKILGMNDLTLLGKIFHFRFDLRGNLWNCDAHMFPYLNMSITIMKVSGKSVRNIVCNKPSYFYSKSVRKLLDKKNLDKFLSNLTHEEGCPFKCKCIWQPNQHKTMVDCSNASLSSIPKIMPEGELLEIDLSYNNIKFVTFHEYFSKTKILNLSRNRIVGISDSALKLLPKDGLKIDLRHNSDLRSLNANFQRIKRCAVRFGIKEINCKCADIWLPGWLSSETCSWPEHYEQLTCNTDDGRIRAEELRKDMVCYVENLLYSLLTVIFSVITLIIIGVSSLIYKFRYEMAIFFKRYKNWDCRTMADYKFDCYISLNENNVALRKWSLRKLIPQLTKSGYNIYCPLKHAEVGKSIDEEVIEKMSMSRNIIVMLSVDYLGQDDGYEAGIRNNIEWRHAWNLFRKNKRLRLILVNFDQMRTSDADNPQMRAFLRLHHTLDFSNRNHSLLMEIKYLLGRPYRHSSLRNGKPKFYDFNVLFDVKESISKISEIQFYKI